MIRQCCCVIVLTAATAAARGEGIVFEHPPDDAGCWASDSEYVVTPGVIGSQRSADNVMLGAPAAIRQITWWGNYGITTPPTAESFRIRLHETSATDGLPGAVSFEAIVLNPMRQATGRYVANGAGGGAREYILEAGLGTPMLLDSHVSYWLEIQQLGDPASTFQWQWSAAEQDGFARVPPGGVHWQQAPARNVDLAFQLSTIPEPGTLALIVLGVGLAGKRPQRL